MFSVCQIDLAYVVVLYIYIYAGEGHDDIIGNGERFINLFGIIQRVVFIAITNFGINVYYASA